MKRVHFVWMGLASAVLVAGAANATASSPSPGLVKGLDGGLYLPYKPAVVRETQQALEQKGLYAGKIDGVLDAATMRATADFQRSNGLQASGMPTPRTREALGTS